MTGGAIVWTTNLDAARSHVADYEMLLSRDEQIRAARYRTTASHDRYIVRRAVLRAGLGRLLRVDPSSLEFGYGPNGKPYLSTPTAARLLRFNLSHSDGLAVFACALGREVGVDVERVRDQPELLELADCCFSSSERATLAAVPPSSQTRAFYRCWTRKEAYVKAVGCGLGAGLSDFDVAFGPDQPPALVSVSWEASEPARWRMDELDLPAGYVGALVVQRTANVGRIARLTGQE
jgi:4'-phosphopantetheinyl transferase